MTFQPMLAGKYDPTDYKNPLSYPVLASHKLDGVRFVIIGGVVMSRSLKPIPNAWVQKQYSKLPEGSDGELIFGNPTHPEAYRNTMSAVMSEDGEPTQVLAHCFDNYRFSGGFQNRFGLVNTWPQYKEIKGAVIVAHKLIHNASELEAFEQAAVDAGHEGIMVRSLNGPYKQGRSTAKEGYLLKVKRFEDSEAVVLDTEELMSNTNAATKDNLGHTERSSHKAGMVGRGVLGALNVRGLEGTYKDVEFSIGTGFTGADDPNGERGKLWKQRKQLVGRIAKFKYFPTGSKDKPRFPVFLGWRDARDR